MNKKLERIEKFCKWADLLVFVLRIAISITVIIQFIGLLWTLILPEGTHSITLWGIQITSPISQDFNLPKPEMIAELVSNILSQSLIVVALFFTNKILRSIGENKTPFASLNIKRLNIIAISAAAIGVVVPIIKMVLLLFLEPSKNASAEFNWISVLFGIIIFSVSLVLDYGLSQKLE